MIRPDQRFSSIADLVAQMNSDCAKAVERLAQEREPLPFPLARLQFAGQL